MMMSVEEKLEEVLLEILSRLPSKSIARFCCVSKLWASLLYSPYFTELFLTRSVTRPRLLFSVYRNNDKMWLLYSSPQPQPQPQKSSLTITAEFQMCFPKTWNLQVSPPQFSDSIYYCKMQNGKGRDKQVVCNPSTGHILWLPKLSTTRSYFGYDPIDKQFSVLSMSQIFPFKFHILNLGSGESFWRSLTCPLEHNPHEDYNTCYPCVKKYNTCINGVLYYTAELTSLSSHKIVCFDLNSEEFNFIDQPWSHGEPETEPIDLVNFKGKLCGISMRWVRVMVGNDERFNLELALWILEDFEKQEWSQQFYHLPSELCNKKYEQTHVCVVGVSVRGDIVLSSYNTTNPFYIYFFNPDKNTVQEVEVKGFEDYKSNMVYSFVDYVEDLRTF